MSFSYPFQVIDSPLANSGSSDSSTDSPTRKLSDQHVQRITVAYTNQPCRRKLQFINGKFAAQKPQTSTVQKRNERERNRVKLINRTFSTLRDHLPSKSKGRKEKKLSKVEVLKTATVYIDYLVRLLQEDDIQKSSQSNYIYTQPLESCQAAWNQQPIETVHCYSQEQAFQYFPNTSSGYVFPDSSQQQLCQDQLTFPADVDSSPW